MNNHSRRPESRDQAFPKGQAALELAGIVPVLALLLLAAVDFGRLYYANIEVSDAARAGAQYGSQSVITAADAAGMKSEAVKGASDLSGVTATAKQCTCMASTTVTKCPTNYCASNPGATFVEVDTAATFTTVVSYPGIPHSVALAGKAVMMVEE
jgi:Flp pilus assembly protein TadG